MIGGVVDTKTVLRIECMDCGCFMGEKKGKGVAGLSHGLCKECLEKRLADLS